MEKENKNEEFPSLVDQAKNLSKFGWDLIRYAMQNEDKILFVTNDVYEERIKICQGCPRFHTAQERCLECGCHIPTKARIVLDGCPLDKWKPNEEQWNENFNHFVDDQMFKEIQEKNKNQD